MKRKYQLSLTKDYVQDWTTGDAIREILQNAIDQETVDPSNKMSIHYFEDQRELHICSATATLQKKTLLLGVTSKADDDSTIGHFGEGYKIALLVLTRLGHPVTILNYAAREVWTSRFARCRKYDNAEVLTIDVEDAAPWTRVPHSNLTFIIPNISKQQYQELTRLSLKLSSPEDTIRLASSYRGDVLLAKNQQGRIYVNGLYVCTLENLAYGYNFPPNMIRLERDRRLADSWDVTYYAGQIWGDVYSSANKTIREDLQNKLAAREYTDLAKLRYVGVNPQMAEDTYAKLQQQYGDTVLPITEQSELDRFQHVKACKPVIVSEEIRHLCAAAPAMQQVLKVAEQEAPKALSPKEKLQEWLQDSPFTIDALKEWSEANGIEGAIGDLLASAEKSLQQFNNILKEMED